MDKSKICIPLRGCANGSGQWVVVDRVGEPSAYGEIWKACCNEKCQYVLKYQNYLKEVTQSGVYGSRTTPEDVVREVKIQKLLSSYGIAPEVMDWWHCKADSTSGGDLVGGVIVMTALQETVYSLLKTYTNPEDRYLIMEACILLLDKMHSLGYAHGDVHLKNIMVTSLRETVGRGSFNPLYYRFYLIDFGFSQPLTPEQSKKDYSSLIEDYERYFGDTPPKIKRYLKSIAGTR